MQGSLVFKLSSHIQRLATSANLMIDADMRVSRTHAQLHVQEHSGQHTTPVSNSVHMHHFSISVSKWLTSCHTVWRGCRFTTFCTLL